MGAFRLMKVLLGTSGWNYKHWSGLFYPSKIPQKDWLKYYAGFFNSVEINMTFYRFPQEKVIEAWKKQVPSGFIFSIKGNRIITHVKKLKDVESLLNKFLLIISNFNEKLGPVLFQLPPSFSYNKKRLESFCELLFSQKIIKDAKFSIELRDKSWVNEETFSILRKYKICLCFSDYPGIEIHSPSTASFIYMRRHGPTSLYSSYYSLKEIEEDSSFIAKFVKNSYNAYVYYNNDANAWAVQNAIQLKEYMEKCL